MLLFSNSGSEFLIFASVFDVKEQLDNISYKTVASTEDLKVAVTDIYWRYLWLGYFQMFVFRKAFPATSFQFAKTASVSGFIQFFVKQTWLTMRASRFCLVVYLQLLFLFVDLFINSFGELFRTADVVLLVLYMWVNLLLLSILTPWVFYAGISDSKKCFHSRLDDCLYCSQVNSLFRLECISISFQRSQAVFSVISELVWWSGETTFGCLVTEWDYRNCESERYHGQLANFYQIFHTLFEFILNNPLPVVLTNCFTSTNSAARSIVYGRFEHRERVSMPKVIFVEFIYDMSLTPMTSGNS